ncbi:uncharacterized protein LOC120013785 isoform X2 [Tripterygium wilfordii]|uniref:uncharacterized protein LOC120013785 isoform X2 n=1 Tax=Tripterygium wilfordii TaxID=458696 RepID=UPI0018F7ECF2|nr:uncharacterized protein LOC120013785 isoform X2 [Tripterygium wilfordii]
MENGHDRRLADKLTGLSINDGENRINSPSSINSNNDNLFQVMKAVEAAEATIKQQVEENNQLRAELYKRIQELDKYKLDESMAQRVRSDYPKDERVRGPYEVYQSVHSAGNQEDGLKSVGNTPTVDPSGTLVIQQDLKPSREDSLIESHVGNNSESSQMNGTFKALTGGRTAVDNTGVYQFSSPSTTSFSPSRYQIEGELEPRFNLSGHMLMPMAEVNNHASPWKQDIALKIREHEEEITQLRKQLADYSIKEAQIRNEKFVLEKRIAYMRLAFDQQQQDLVDAASKALSYRQDIIEENIRLTYALQAAQQERSTFVSSLLPLLADYSLQPPVPDAQSIVSNVKVLFKHLQEKLIVTESKLKDSQYQLAPWRSEVNHSNFAPQAPQSPIGVALMTTNKNELELVPQPMYSQGKMPINSDGQTAADWDLSGHHQYGLGGNVAKNLETDDVARYSPLASRNSAAHDVPTQFAVTRQDGHAHYVEEGINKQVTFRDPISSGEMDDPTGEGHQKEREPSGNWVSGNPTYTATLDDPSSSYSPYLPPVLEEPSSSFSEAADDDPLPAIEGLQISGEALPGRELQACGYSINGTTSCNFEWVRHLEDGSVNYIEGAKQPNYLVTADDVDTYLAIEVQPLDNRKRKGELVKVFANEHRKITCDPDMQNDIEKTLYSSHASYKVSLLVSIPYGLEHDKEFIIITSSGVEHHLREDNSEDGCARDTIVLTLRLFIIRASERRKGKKRGLFFNK